ncbi:MAG: glycosyltransferase family 4 protein [Desulfobacterales bacterium]|nr:glycosyltransferase family 4 protein [Desulfobacterales bacterium]
MGKNIGFVSTRFAGTDGVTLESSKWAQVIRKSGHSCFWFGGELDRNPQNSFLVPEAFFKHKDNQWINDQILGKNRRSRAVTEAIHSSRSFLKTELYEFIKKSKIDMLIAENALTIPLHVPLGLALTEIIAETQIPTIAHHHDFYWERIRFTVNAVNDYIRMAFPPTLSNVEHVVINSAAKEELALRTGISSTIIPNVVDFENPPFVDEKHTEDFRNKIGLKPEDVMILQPSRVVQRKGIEHAIELVHELKDPRYKLVISHEAGDEGFEYAEWLVENAKDRGVDLRLFDTGMADPANDGLKNPNQYSLWDIYPHADFITYPSLYEGFGNAFLEAIYFKKPMLVNRYATFVRDIEPKGFDLIVMDGFLTKRTVQKVREIIESPEKKAEMVNHNYKIATRYYSYSVLRKWLNSLIINFFGIEI